MGRNVIQLEQCVPVAFVADGAIVARDGAVTIGWELFPPEEYTITQEQYDTMTTLMASAFRGLPEWTMVHKQDIYRKRRYHSEPGGHFLDDCFSAHFEGREYLEHRQYLWFTSSTTASRLTSKGGSTSSTGSTSGSPSTPPSRAVPVP